jgi:hypothetical protein
MITAAVSTILGMLGGVLPDVVKEIRDSRAAVREREFLRLQAELALEAAKVTADSRLRELETNAFAQEAQAFREHMTAIVEAQARPTGIVWIDGFNAMLRPACTALIILLFMGTAIPFVMAVIHQFETGAVTAVQMAQIIWGSLVGESILATLGFLYGYRSAAKK